MTPEQIAELVLAQRSDGKDRHWVELYLSEFPIEEQRDVDQLQTYIDAGAVLLHETRNKDGLLLTWSMSQDYPAPAGSDEPSFWLGCWTVTRRSVQGTGLGRVHFPRVIEALKTEKPDYIGRLTEIESTEGLLCASQPVRRARFYKSLGLQELDISYEIPLYQPVDAKEYIPQTKLGKGIKGQLLYARFNDKPVTAQQVRSIVRHICQKGYNVAADDPYIDARLAGLDDKRENYLVPLRILSSE